MKKKIIITLVSLVILVAGLFSWEVLKNLPSNKPCAFCNPKVIQTHTFYEDDLIRGMCSYKPVKPYHCMAVTKRHIATFEDISEAEWIAIQRLLQKINVAVQQINGPSSYLILKKTGREVGQTVPHVHVHYIAKKKASYGIAAWGLLWDFFINAFQRTLNKEELAHVVKTMQQALLERKPSTRQEGILDQTYTTTHDHNPVIAY